jgi:hypothetical protein
MPTDSAAGAKKSPPVGRQRAGFLSPKSGAVRGGSTATGTILALILNFVGPVPDRNR